MGSSYLRIIGDLPYYVPVSSNTGLSPSRVGAEGFSIFFQHINKSRMIGIQKSEGVEDGRGNMVSSRAIVEFLVERAGPPEEAESFLNKAIEITNNALLAIKYVSVDYRIRQISHFDHHVIQILEKLDDGSIVFLSGEEGDHFGPHGLRMIGSLNQEDLTRVWLHFNGLRPIYPSSLLLIDSKYYLDFGDISHSIFDIATSLQIHVEVLIQAYSKVARQLLAMTLDSNGIYNLYDQVLVDATGKSLRERPDLFIWLEYIWQIRNSIAHRWIPQFQVISPFKDRTRYLADHLKKDGHIVSAAKEVDEMRLQAGNIFEYAEDRFFEKYGEASL